jgi:hypothetical protein
MRLDNPSMLDTGEHLDVSTDGMRSWRAVDQAMVDAHAVPHAFWLNPEDGSLLAYSSTESVNGSFDGPMRLLWVSADGGHMWRRLSTPDNSMRYLAVQWPKGGMPWHVCASDQVIYAAPAQQYNHLACTQDGGGTWTDRPTLDIALSCSTCLKGHPYSPVSTLTLVGIAPDGAVLANANDFFDADGTAHTGLFRLAPGATQWESLGAIPGTDPNNTNIYLLPSGLLWLVGSPPFTTTMFNEASFRTSSGTYIATYP